MKDALTKLGYSIIGPLVRVSDALLLARVENFDAAILDINVKGEMIYDVADAIAARDIPFVFVTGYGSESVDERFKTVPILQKPVDQIALERVLASKKKGNGHCEAKPEALAGPPPRSGEAPSRVASAATDHL
jgi:two-component SAPR family response regulator